MQAYRKQASSSICVSTWQSLPGICPSSSACSSHAVSCRCSNSLAGNQGARAASAYALASMLILYHLRTAQASTLRDCRVVFSGGKSMRSKCTRKRFGFGFAHMSCASVFPTNVDPKKTEAWQLWEMAEVSFIIFTVGSDIPIPLFSPTAHQAFGCTCSSQYSEDATHVVAARPVSD